jgi:hypothetical protein
MKTLHNDELIPLATNTGRHSKPVLAYAALALAALLMIWVVASPRLVHGQSKAGEKQVAATSLSAAELSSKEQAIAKSKARLTEEELERLRAQIIETSKQNKAKAKNK